MLKHKRSALSIALAVAMAPTWVAAQTAAPAQASDAQQGASERTAGAVTDLDKVQVTGLRRAIEGAISVKRDSTSIVEAISAEDIGRLPDVSIAESLARLPGLAAQRVAGRAQVISVRGLSPDFSTTLLNGREVVSTGDNRSVEFDQYPSELVSGVTVYKTPDAGLVGQGLSGTVDMQTARPLSYNERVIAIGGRYQRNSLGKAANVDPYGNRFNVSYIDQFADRTIGLTIGYAHTDMPIQENQVGLYEPWQQVNAQRQRPGVADGVYFSDGIKALRRTGNQKRDGVMATLQYRPSNAWTSTLDAFHTEAEQIDTANQFELNLSNYNGGYTPGLNISNVRVNDRNTFIGGDASGVYPLVRGMYNKREDKIDAFGWNNEITAGSVKIVADLNYSKATRDELNLENNLQRAPMPQLDTVGVSVVGNGFSQLSPGMNYSNPDELFLTNTIYGSGYGKVPSVEDVLKGARLQANFPMPEALSWFSDLDVGVNYANRRKQKTQPEGNITLGAQGEATVAADLQYAPVNLGFAGLGSLPAWNVPATVARYMVFNPSDDASFLVSKAWTVEEKITTAWLRANINTEWGEVGVRGNIGVQLQSADQSSQANYWDASQPAGSEVRPIDDGKTYRDWLPSLNLAFQFPYEQTLRFAMAKQVARPRVDQLRASLEFGVDTSTGRPGASGGNPMLDPWRANALDISYEKYFADRAYVAAAFFYKDLKSYIYTQSRDNYDFSALVAGYVPPPGSAPVLTTGTFSAPFNGKGGTLRGVELTASLPLDLVFAPLEGFGIQASATFNDSDVKIRDPESASSVGDGEISLPGLSKRVYNLTAYYEHKGFEARVSQRRRSDFIGEIGNFNGNRTLRYVVGENITDAQISYNFSEASALSGLTLLLQASNLSNSPYRTYAETKDRPLEYIEWGRTFVLGVNYKF
ncbi:TonB-dependent receptor [Xanthomonas phaseoli]|uniref:TonB-dependent receptor n=1 Tax=Xanthomonas phaseoli pv. dieffenbachiae TaxID=92828 RepID=A0A1V9HCG6_9XANT|nr:TonB-dependent receptor [Xanthomonas phaseoli]MBO9789108.1 TonB-dependent receptor [Xanthomonas phaseoli pv. dieffenbachiae]MBO9833052.1 TonB-dependent receptor [Xanthomonas phaseoli pv. dieffenbachiae]MBO9838047.1 TonB-dependent receptor [Xanthomonas phaseoli pv. dieffenbachiae]MBO9843075.1 TonB-dependent receptor [Xanthomonas phaseoli pv. dieffenbachiae]MBO9854098.1 TonB-dependent receptor [Xanthomonas phaseoli pv. dieffenbachiae]